MSISHNKTCNSKRLIINIFYWYTFQMKFGKFFPNNLGGWISHSSLFCKSEPAESHHVKCWGKHPRSFHWSALGRLIALDLKYICHFVCPDTFRKHFKKKWVFFVQLQFSIKCGPFGNGLICSVHIPSHRYLAKSSFLFWRGG